MPKFTIPETNIICIFMGNSKAETIMNIMDGIQYMSDSDLAEVAEQAIAGLDGITESEFDDMNFNDNFTV